ncbi:MAG: PAS domain S-box protein, partial [Proteobacteria bacterium]|nr:PAS domain S-box protein [Pseudomonadota bacterium]
EKKHHEIDIKTSFGKVGNFDCRLAPIRVGNEPHLLFMVDDITERKQAEKALRESEDKFAKTFKSNASMMALSTLENGLFIDVNDEFLRILGYDRDEVIGKSSADLQLFGDIKQRDTMRQIVKEQGNIRNFEIIYRAKHGELRHGLFSGELIHLQNQTCWLTLLHDITGRKRAEEALRESEERLAAFMNSATESFGIYDSDLNLVEINKAGLAWWPVGTKKEDLIGRNFTELAPNLKKTGRYELYMNVIRTGKALHLTDVVPHPKFGDIHLEVKAFKVGDGLGLITVDVTERVRAEEQIKVSLREKVVLLKEIHHRVKNNLAIVSSLLSLQADAIPDEPIRAAFQESQNRIQAMARIHEHLYRSPDLAWVDMAEYTRGVANHLVWSYGTRAITLQTDVSDVELDIDRAIPCGLIINELVSNALKHAFPPGWQRPE